MEVNTLLLNRYHSKEVYGENFYCRQQAEGTFVLAVRARRHEAAKTENLPSFSQEASTLVDTLE